MHMKLKYRKLGGHNRIGAKIGKILFGLFVPIHYTNNMAALTGIEHFHPPTVEVLEIRTNENNTYKLNLTAEFLYN